VSPAPNYTPPEPQSSKLLTALVAGALIALVAANIYLYVQVGDVRTEIAQMRDSVNTELTNVKNTSSVTTASQKQHLEDLQTQLETARAQAKTLATTAANSAASQAKAEAEARAEQLAREIQAEQARVQQQVTSEISAVKNSATAANSRIADVSTDVGTVKTNLAATNAELQKTIADLKTARGDLGVQSGLIATNSTQLDALRRLGERNYIEFKLGKTKAPQRVGDITLKLTKIDQKKNKYSVDVMADDKLTEKKDKNVNEPVQFYTTKGGHIPYELVVNSVGKDQIAGYLSTPKDQVSR
jgi:chromosome segregation ATPase